MRTLLTILVLTTAATGWLAGHQEARWKAIRYARTVVQEIQERTQTELRFAETVRGMDVGDPAAKATLASYHLFGDRFHPAMLRRRMKSHFGPADAGKGMALIREAMDTGDYSRSWWFWRRQGIPGPHKALQYIAQGDWGLASHLSVQMAQSPCGDWDVIIRRMESAVASWDPVRIGGGSEGPTIDYAEGIMDNLGQLKRYRMESCPSPAGGG